MPISYEASKGCYDLFTCIRRANIKDLRVKVAQEPEEDVLD